MHRKLPQDNRYIDMIVLLAILATGILLVLFHVPADSLATVAAALSAVYGTWASTRHAPPSGNQSPHSGNPPAPTGTTETKRPVS